MSNPRYSVFGQVSLITSEFNPDEGGYTSTTEASKCKQCGSYVWDENQHDVWHDSLDHTARRANRPNGMETYG